MPQEVFTGLKIAIIGDFGSNWPKKKMGDFIQNNGGRVAPADAKGLTHIICTTKAFEAGSAAIRAAVKQGVPLVSFDWFEDSLQDRRKKREARYEVAKLSRERREAREKRSRVRKALVASRQVDFAQNVAEARHAYQMVGYQLYADPTGFEYDVGLLRVNILDNRTERFSLRLHTTHEAPHYFACMSSEFLPSGRCSRVVLASPGSSFEAAFDAFRRGFRAKTFKDWAHRRDTKPVLLPDGSPNPVAWSYVPPADGPTGMDGPVVLDDEGFLSEVVRERLVPPPEPTVEIVAHDASHPTGTAHARTVGPADPAAGIVHRNWGVVADDVARAERLADQRHQEGIREFQDARQQASRQQLREIDDMNGQDGAARVVHGGEGEGAMPRGVVQGSWGGSVVQE